MHEAIKPYVEKLKKYGVFAHQAAGIPYFFYEDAQSPEMQALEKEYQVNKIALGDNTLQRVLSLMDWVHHALFFVGNNLTPKENNTRSIMGLGKTGALFCFYQVIVLAELLRSIGIKARVVSCLPETFHGDSHMAVLAFDQDTSKWFFADPTFNTYFYSAENKALDVFEIREIYRRGDIPPFRHIRIDKQWTLICNGVVCETYDEWYALYMAKNCFRFMSPADNYYGCLSAKNVSYIAINPDGCTARNGYDEGRQVTYIQCAEDFLQRPDVQSV